MTGGVLREAYQRFSRTGPEWGEDKLTNHGPMAAEVLVRHGHADEVDRWVDRYIRRLDDLPERRVRITESNWRTALGDERRVTDWGLFFEDQLTRQSWRNVLTVWWQRLIPGIAAGATHGVIRVGHVVRALQASEANPQFLSELAHGLAFWAARMKGPPQSGEPAGTLAPDVAIDALPRVPSQHGKVADRFRQIDQLPTWSGAVSALRPPATSAEVPDLLADLVAASTVRYLRVGHASPVLLVHTATAPNAVLHTLPALPEWLWAPSLSAVWRMTAALFAAYAPHTTPHAPSQPASANTVADVVDLAAAHGDEHVIKFADTAAEVYVRTGNVDALAAARLIGDLIDRPY